MLQHSFRSRGRAALRTAGVAGLALLAAGLNVAWSLLPHRKPHPADMTQRATAVGPLLHASPKHPPVPAAVAEATPQPAPSPEPRPLHKQPAKMTLRATAVGPLTRAKPRHAVAAQPTPQPTATPKPVVQKRAPAPVVAAATPRPVPTPEPRRKRKVADMTLRAAAVGPLLPVKPRHPVAVAASEEPSAHPEDTPPPEPTPPVAQEVRRVGVVRVIGAGGTFLLVEARDSDVSAELPTGTELRCRGSAATGGEQTALLRVSPERRAPFVVADIVSGSPQVGDGVYLPEEASQPR